MTPQYWLDKDDDKIRLIVLTPEALYSESLTPVECRQRVEALKAGNSPSTLFGTEADHVSLRALEKVTADARDTDIELTHRDGKDSTDLTLSISSAEIREAVFAALQQVMANRFQTFEDHYSRARAAFGSLMTLTVFGLLTWWLAAAAAGIRAAEEIELSGRKKGLKKIFIGTLDLLGPTGVTIIGGLICALVLWYLALQLRQPPQLRILQAGQYKPASPLITGAKYLLLAGVWGWVALRFV